MTPIIVKHTSSLADCSISHVNIGLKQAVVERAGWNINERIQVGFIEKANCILLRRVSASEAQGFKLGYSNTKTKTGGRIGCRAFLSNFVQTLVELPKRGIAPVFPKNCRWTIALMLEPFQWEQQDFSKAGANKAPKDAIGVYELLGSGGAVLRVGEGKIRERMNVHLNDKRFSPPTVKALRYVALDDLEDGKILEKIRIEE